MKIKKTYLILRVLLYVLLTFNFALSTFNLLAQSGGAAINTTGTAADNSAILDVSSTTQGVLMPRMTTAQINTIASPAIGLIIYNTDCNLFVYWNGNAWIASGNIGSVASPGTITGNATPCQNATGVSYSISIVSGATGYNWTVPAGASIISGQGTVSITVNYATTNGNVCVTAGNTCGTSIASCLAISLIAPASIPTANTANEINCSSFSANWTSASGANTYFIDVATDEGFASLVINDQNVGNFTTYSVTGLNCNTTYYYRIRGGASCGNSPNSNTITLNTTAPSIPVTNTASGITKSSFSANWASTNCATNYYIDVSSNNSFSSFVSGYNNLNVANVLTYNITGLTCNTTYYYRVRAANICGTSGNSDIINATTSSCETIAFDAVSGPSQTNGGSHTFSHTIGNGTNRILFVSVTVATSRTVSSVKYNNVDMHLIRSESAADGTYSIHLYYLLNSELPVGGTYNAVLTYSGSGWTVGAAVSYTGVKQSGTFDALTSQNTASTTSLTTSLTSTVDNCWFVLYAESQATISAGSGSTQKTTTGHQRAIFDSNGPKTPAGSYSMTVNIGGAANIGVIMVSMSPVP
ncbi:MAG: fibronectin type III domain-containing protein [Bacteroidetes bacterium]|nr:fibronectin type III domain-containing protein [Bacteroidota bacterium]